MHRKCNECHDKKVETNDFAPSDDAWWYEWKVVDVERKNKTTGEIVKVKKTVKERVESSVENLVDEFEDTVTRKLCETGV